MDDIAQARQEGTGASTAVDGCHAGRDTMIAAARCRQERGLSIASRRIIPKGPHDQPQSMCPAFGSLRVGLRMRRVATILSGSACCVYGLTFTSHFYGARRSVGYVPFDSETLVTGKLFEDIPRRRRADSKAEDYDAVVVINLCVPTAPAFRSTGCRATSTACASSASTCRASAFRRMPRPRMCWRARCCAMRGRKPSRARAASARAAGRRTPISLIGECSPPIPSASAA